MIELSVCIGSSCHIKGSYNVIQTFQQMIEENNLHGQVDFKGTFCMKQCDKPGVALALDNDKFNIDPAQARTFFKENVLPKVK